ncbi:nitrate/nitrite transporter [Sphingobium sp.]|uniref:nitrate/nitrite transporter n=1 Tax=Sphingobium sp. TaxID=1912891 RepID=UPI0035C73D91
MVKRGKDDACLPPEPWRVMAVLSVIGFLLIGGMLTSLSVYMVLMQPHFRWSETEMGAGPVALLLGMSAGNLQVSRAMRTVGVRGLFALGAGLAVCGWIAAGFTEALPSFMAAMALAGLGVGMATIVPGIAVLSQSFHRHRGLAIALFIGACALASATMPMVSGRLIEALGWRATFWFIGGAAGLVCAGLAHALPRTLCETSGGDVAPEPGLTREEVLKKPGYWLLVFVLTVSQMSLNAILFNLIAYLRHGGFDPADAVAIYSITNFMSLPGLVIGGLASDRISARILLPAILALQAAGTLALLGVGGAPLWQGRIAIALFIMLWGSVAGLPAQAGAMLLTEMIGQRAYAAMLGIIFTINGFVGALAPVAMGWAYEASRSYAVPVFCLGALTLLASFAALFCRNAPCVALTELSLETE